VTGFGDTVDPAPYDLNHLPYGSLIEASGRRFAAVRIGEHALDLAAFLADHPYAELFAAGDLDRLLAAGAGTWTEVRRLLIDRLTHSVAAGELRPALLPLADLTPSLPFSVADYVDFYSSEQHARNVGRILRPQGEPLTPNWKHLPIGYHGRAGTVVVSGTPVARPSGQARDPSGRIRVGPSQRLDVEVEVGFVLGGRSRPGEPVAIDAAAEHLFGVCLLNDWSARDIQAWESAPLGPFLGKSFATTISAWITPMAALDAAWIPVPEHSPQPSSYLVSPADRGGLDLSLRLEINGTVVSSPPFATMYWTPAQMLAHLTVNGASVRPGDLFGSGTVSGPRRDQFGSLLELTANGSQPLTLPDGRRLGFLDNGDEVVIRGTAPGPAGTRLELGECRGRIIDT